MEEGLVVEAIGKQYSPEKEKVIVYQNKANTSGSTSVRNTDDHNLEWKEQGYFQRNRDLGQVFTPAEDFLLDAIILRTGPSDKAVLSSTPGAKVYIQFFEVAGTPYINDNGTPQGKDAKHGFSKNHRCDDYMEGITYTPLRVITGGIFPQIPVTYDGRKPVNGDNGTMYYMRWKLTGRPVKFSAGKRYAFMVGLEETGTNHGFTLANYNAAGEKAVPSLYDDHDAYKGGWGLRREGDGTVPPTMLNGLTAPPKKKKKLNKMIKEALFATGAQRYKLEPTTDGYPDVDTYRDLEFALEVHLKKQ